MGALAPATPPMSSRGRSPERLEFLALLCAGDRGVFLPQSFHKDKEREHCDKEPALEGHLENISQALYF